MKRDWGNCGEYRHEERLGNCGECRHEERLGELRGNAGMKRDWGELRGMQSGNVNYKLVTIARRNHTQNQG